MNTFFVCNETTISCSASLECAAKFTSMFVFTFNFCYYCTLRNSSFSPLHLASYQHSLTRGPRSLHSLQTSKVNSQNAYRLFAENWLTVRLPSLIAFVEFFFTLFFSHQRLRFYYMSVPFCCVRCACINSTKTKSSRSERERGGGGRTKM